MNKTHPFIIELERLLFKQSNVELTSEQTELLQKINQSLLGEQFLSSMINHELRSPLAGLSSTIDVILQSDLNDREVLTKRLRRMNTFSNRMEFILDHLSDMEPLESVSQQNTGLTKHLDQWVEQEVSFYKSHHTFEHDIRIEKNSSISPIVFQTDYHLMSLILKNMLDNAIKFSNAPTHIIIRVEATPSFIQLSCIDQGMGLGSDEPEDLMGAFTRGTKTEHIPGTGLGLSIANRAAQQINGRLKLENNHDKKGATCSLRFDLIGQNHELGLGL